MRQRGQSSRLTAAEIAEVREAWAALERAKARRRELTERHGFGRDEFFRYGTGVSGKKPRRAA